MSVVCYDVNDGDMKFWGQDTSKKDFLSCQGIIVERHRGEVRIRRRIECGHSTRLNRMNKV